MKMQQTFVIIIIVNPQIPNSRRNLRVLVPGAGLARLALNVAQLGK